MLIFEYDKISLNNSINESQYQQYLEFEIENLAQHWKFRNTWIIWFRRDANNAFRNNRLIVQLEMQSNHQSSTMLNKFILYSKQVSCGKCQSNREMIRQVSWYHLFE